MTCDGRSVSSRIGRGFPKSHSRSASRARGHRGVGLLPRITTKKVGFPHPFSAPLLRTAHRARGHFITPCPNWSRSFLPVPPYRPPLSFCLLRSLLLSTLNTVGVVCESPQSKRAFLLGACWISSFEGEHPDSLRRESVKWRGFYCVRKSSIL